MHRPHSARFHLLTREDEPRFERLLDREIKPRSPVLRDDFHRRSMRVSGTTHNRPQRLKEIIDKMQNRGTIVESVSHFPGIPLPFRNRSEVRGMPVESPMWGKVPTGNIRSPSHDGGRFLATAPTPHDRGRNGRSKNRTHTKSGARKGGSFGRLRFGRTRGNTRFRNGCNTRGTLGR